MIRKLIAIEKQWLKDMFNDKDEMYVYHQFNPVYQNEHINDKIELIENIRKEDEDLLFHQKWKENKYLCWIEFEDNGLINSFKINENYFGVDYSKEIKETNEEIEYLTGMYNLVWLMLDLNKGDK